MCTAIKQDIKRGVAGLLLAAIGLGLPQMASADIQHLDDVIITFSLCVGNDCVNGESFGFDTIRMKENNVRLHFDDTSTSASFPRNDWRLIANDSSNGGAEYLAIEDSTAGRQIFRVEAGAPANSLYVEDAGRIGVKTSTPVVDIHVRNGNTPTLRLEQDGSSGFTAQTYDIAGNEANFFIRDVTNGSKLFFRSKPGAPGDSIFIAADGDIGFTTDNPDADADIHLRRTTGDAELRLEASSTTIGQARIVLKNPDADFLLINNGNRMQFFDRGGGAGEILTLREITGRVGIRNNSPAHPLEVGTNNTNGNGAHVTVDGIWTDVSTRTKKERIVDLDGEAALEAFDQLNPVTYYGKDSISDEQYIGFIAEDVPDLVAMNGRKGIAAIEIAALVTKVVQEQRATIESQKETIASLVQRVEKLEASKAAE